MNLLIDKPRPHMDALNGKPTSLDAVLTALGHDYPGQAVLHGEATCDRCGQTADPLYAVSDGRVCLPCLRPPTEICERAA